MNELYWSKRTNGFSAMAKWHVFAEKLGMPPYQVIAFANRLEEIANDAANQGHGRGYVGHFDPDEVSRELGMSLDEAERIFAAFQEGVNPWIVDDHLVGFVERVAKKEDKSWKLRDQRRNARVTARRELTKLADGGYITAARKQQIEARLLTMADDELFALPEQLGREAFGAGPEQSHASHGVGHGVGGVAGEKTSHAPHAWATPKREREEKKDSDEIDDGDSHASHGVGHGVGSVAGAAPDEERPGDEAPPKQPLVSQQAYALADAVCEAAGTSIDDPNLAGISYAAQIWIDRRYDRALILSTAASVARRYPNKPLNYYATAIERAHEDSVRRKNAPRLPLVQVNPGNKGTNNDAQTNPGANTWQRRRDARHDALAELDASVEADRAAAGKSASGGSKGRR